MPKVYTRLHRLLRVLTLIQSGRGWTPARLAEACGASEHKTQRIRDPDLARLVDAWPDLPAAVRAGIMAMVGATHGDRP